jgi:metal-responsive CopG/Arc/MetJ family transcriptional regulator
MGYNPCERKKPGPKPTGKGEQVVVRVQPDLLGAIDKHVAATGAESRAASIREILTGFFKRKGFL